jgi:hypothetical protein
MWTLLFVACSRAPEAPVAPVPEPQVSEPAVSEIPVPKDPPPLAPPPPKVFDTPPVPPKAIGAEYVDRGVCPGECCTYGKWSVAVEAPVVEAPGSSKVLATLEPKQPVTAVTGETHMAPIPAQVLRDRTIGSEKHTAKVKAGDVVWLLSPVGEGVWRIYAGERIVEEQALFVDDAGCLATPPTDPATCWAKSEAVDPGPVTWWVKVKLADGRTGWVDNTHDVLTGFDGCG